MTIQLNTDNNINGSEGLKVFVTEMISASLSRFDEHLTRVEVHLNDENGHKSGGNDKRCMLEARPEKMQPIAVTHHADTIEEAVKGAIDKLKKSLDTTLGKMRSH